MTWSAWIDEGRSQQRFEDLGIVFAEQYRVLDEVGEALDALEKTSMWNFPKRRKLWKRVDEANLRYDALKRLYERMVEAHGRSK